MSADGIGVLGFAILAVGAAPILIAGASVAGVAYGVAKLTQYAAETQHVRQQKREAQRRRRAAEFTKIDAEDRAQIEELLRSFSSVRDGYEQSAEHLRRQQEDGIRRLSDELTEALRLGSSDMLQLEQRAQNRKSELEQDWRAQSRRLEQQYQRQLGEIARNMGERVRAEMSRFDRMMDTAHKDSHVRDTAVSQLLSARSAVKAVSIELGTAPPELQDCLHRAEDYFNQGLFINAYSLSSSIVLQCYDAISDGLFKQAATEALEDKIAQRFAALEGRMDAARNLHFIYGGTKYEDDLSRFMPELFSAIRDRLREVKNPNSGSLGQRLAVLQELDEDFREVMRLAAQKLLYAYTENDSAESITTVMEEQGFHMEDYAYEGDREGGAIHINYVNSISRERLTVVLTPGEDGLQVEIHNFGDGSGRVDPIRQDHIQEMLECSLNICISCTNRGGVSTRTDAANLAAIRRFQQNA